MQRVEFSVDVFTAPQAFLNLCANGHQCLRIVVYELFSHLKEYTLFVLGMIDVSSRFVSAGDTLVYHHVQLHQEVVCLK